MSRCAIAAVLATLAWLSSSCIRSSLVDCGDGISCPVGSVCVFLPSETTCVAPDQLEACNGLADGAECVMPGTGARGSCVGGACLPIVCGNNRIEPGEACDDGNTVTGDGTCSADCRSNETCGNGFVDPLRLDGIGTSLPNEQCDDGNLLSSDGCSSTCVTETLVWSQAAQPLPALFGAATAYDPERRRIVLFGGSSTDSQGEQLSGATYEWEGTRWVKVPTASAPSPRADHAMAYDPISHRVLLFGGRAGDDNAPYGDAWTWDGTNWTHVLTAVPPARSQQVMAYDGTRHQIVMFGGYDGKQTVDDTWVWDGVQFSKLATTSTPASRAGALMAFDPERGALVLAGGSADSLAVNGPQLDTWELRGSAWIQTTTAPATFDRVGHAAFDPVGHRIVAYRGGNTWAYNGTEWVDLGAGALGSRFAFVMETDPLSSKVVLTGGADSAQTIYADTWIWDGASWTQPPAPFEPTPISLASSAYDSDRGVAWVFGGSDGPNSLTSEMWSFDGSSWRDQTAVGPSGRAFQGMAYDRARKQVVMFGGADAGGMASNDTWLWDGSSWTSVHPAISPSARGTHAMVYDARRQVVVLFCGALTDGTTYFDDTWEWNGSTWTEITTATRPPARAVEGAAYDEARGRVIVFAGFGPNIVPLTDVWEYDGTDWTLVDAATPLPNRFFAPLAYDPAAQIVALYGGRTFGGSTFADTWTRSSVWQERTPFLRPGPLGQHAMFTSPTGAGVMIFGGSNDDVATPTNSETWWLHYVNEQAPEVCTASRDNDGDGLAGCADPDCWRACTPQCPPGATCDPAAPRCGDGVCNAAIENCRICPQDCSCTAACGDTFCDAGETQASCPGDCTP